MTGSRAGLFIDSNAPIKYRKQTPLTTSHDIEVRPERISRCVTLVDPLHDTIRVRASLFLYAILRR